MINIYNDSDGAEDKEKTYLLNNIINNIKGDYIGDLNASYKQSIHDLDLLLKSKYITSQEHFDLSLRAKVRYVEYGLKMN